METGGCFSFFLSSFLNLAERGKSESPLKCQEAVDVLVSYAFKFSFVLRSLFPF